MPSSVALLLFLVITSALLVIDHKASRGLSLSLWIPTLWILYCACVPISSWVTGVQQSNLSIADGNPLDRKIQLSFIVISLIALYRKGFSWASVPKEYSGIAVLLLFMFISIAWSDFTFVSFKRYFKVFGTVAMGFLLATENSPKIAIIAVMRRASYILIPLSLLVIKYYPHVGLEFARYSGMSSWSGVASNKNTLGALCLVLCFFQVLSFHVKSIKDNTPNVKYKTFADKIILILTLYLLLGGGKAFSATSLIVLTVGLLIVYYLHHFRKYADEIGKFILASIVILFLGLFTCNLLFGLSPVEIVAKMVGRKATLTGRADQIWPQLLETANEHALFGVGYGGFWVSGVLEFDKLTVNQAHNGYIDIYIELGIVGLIIFALFILNYYRRCIILIKSDFSWGSIGFAFLVMACIHNYTESSFLKSTIFMWNAFIVVVIATIRESLNQRQIASQ